VAGNMALHCSYLHAIANAALITAKHIYFHKDPDKEPVEKHE